MMRIQPLAQLYDNAENETERKFYADALRRALRAEVVRNDYRKEITDWVRAQGFTAGYGKIETIKKIRTEKNWGLKEAKDWLEANIPPYIVNKVVNQDVWLPPVR
jgi:ribosomal protein L7/L12